MRILAEVICTTLRPEFRVPTNLFLLFARHHSAKIFVPLSFNLSIEHDHSTKIQGLHGFISFMCTHHSTEIYDCLSFILSFVNNHSTKTWGPKRFTSFICTRPFDKYICSYFIYSFFCARPFDQKLVLSLILIFYLHTTI